jgi:regulatory protein
MDNSQVFERYYNLSLNYLSIRPRSEKEILDYLRKKQKNAPNLTDDLITQIIEKLKEYKFINDREFTKFWMEQRTKSKHKPIRAIEFELKQKGIGKDLIDESLADIDTKDLDYENAKKLADRKMAYYRNLDPKKRQEKVMRYLIGKGFSYDIVKKVID